MDTFTAGRYSPHGMNWVDQETCVHEQDKTSPPKKTPEWQLPHTPGIVSCSQDFSRKLEVSTHRARTDMGQSYKQGSRHLCSTNTPSRSTNTSRQHLVS